MSLSHMLLLGIICVIFIPPEKLPEIMRNIGRFINDIKRQTHGVWGDVAGDIKKEIKLTPADMLKKIAVEQSNASETEPSVDERPSQKSSNDPTNS